MRSVFFSRGALRIFLRTRTLAKKKVLESPWHATARNFRVCLFRVRSWWQNCIFYGQNYYGRLPRLYPYFVGNQAILCGFWALMIQNGGFGLQTPCFAQTLSFVRGSESLGRRLPRQHVPTTIRDSETTIKIKFCVSEGGGLGRREENRPKMLFFFLVGSATTIKFWKFKFYRREILLSLHRLLYDSSQICGSKLQSAFHIRWRMLAAQFWVDNRAIQNHAIPRRWRSSFKHSLTTHSPLIKGEVHPLNPVPASVPASNCTTSLGKNYPFL